MTLPKGHKGGGKGSNQYGQKGVSQAEQEADNAVRRANAGAAKGVAAAAAAEAAEMLAVADAYSDSLSDDVFVNGDKIQVSTDTGGGASVYRSPDGGFKADYWVVHTDEETDDELSYEETRPLNATDWRSATEEALSGVEDVWEHAMDNDLWDGGRPARETDEDMRRAEEANRLRWAQEDDELVTDSRRTAAPLPTTPE